MATTKGQNLRIYIGEVCVAAATTASVHVNQELEDSSTKDSTADWTEQEVTGLSWDASCEALVSGETENIGSIITKLINKTKVAVTFTTTSGANNRVAVRGATKWSGNAYVSDFNITAANKQNATISLTLTGTGALTKGTNTTTT